MILPAHQRHVHQLDAMADDLMRLSHLKSCITITRWIINDEHEWRDDQLRRDGRLRQIWHVAYRLRALCICSSMRWMAIHISQFRIRGELLYRRQHQHLSDSVSAEGFVLRVCFTFYWIDVEFVCVGLLCVVGRRVSSVELCRCGGWEILVFCCF